MEIYLGTRAMRQVRLSVADAIDAGDTDTLRDDLIQAFTENDIAEIERRIDSGDFYDFISELLDEWSCEELDELLELLEGYLSEADVDFKYALDDDDDDDEGSDDDELDTGDESYEDDEEM